MVYPQAQIIRLIVGLALGCFIAVSCLQLQINQSNQHTTPTPTQHTHPKTAAPSQIINTTTLLWPLPKKVSSNSSAGEGPQFSINDIVFKLDTFNDDVQEIIRHYLVDVFRVGQAGWVGQYGVGGRANSGYSYRYNTTNSNAKQITLTISIRSPKYPLPQLPAHQSYTLTIRQSESWQLLADYYPGFVRGFDTFAQLLEKSKTSSDNYFIRNRPVFVDDVPDFWWRGLMIDTSRHYLGVDQIRKIVDGLMYNKMNVLHWHIVDQDSFPMQIPSRPQISQYGSLAGTYTQSDITSLISYAKTRAIRIVPQYDTPAHTRSWGRSPQLANITFQGWIGYHGQFDPTLNLTYDVVKEVGKYVDSVFVDRYVHLGGDQVDGDVWDQHPKIKEWMKQNNISNYEELQVYYRRRQRQILKQISPTKKAIYWANQQINLPVPEQDIIQWWGQTKNIQQLKIHKNQIILSNYDMAYLDVGFGDQLGDPYRTQISWRDMYAFQPKIQGVKVIGGQACMWSQLTYWANIQRKIWIRGSVMAERLWNGDVDINKGQQLLNVVKRLIQQRKRMQIRGYKCSPVTVGLCQKDPTICFG